MDRGGPTAERDMTAGTGWRATLAAIWTLMTAVAATAGEPAPVIRTTGAPRAVYDGAAYGLQFIPDGHLSVLRRADGTNAVWWGGGVRGGAGRTIGATSKDLVSFTPFTLVGGVATGELAPAGGTTAFDADYAGPGSVMPDPAYADDRHLIMFYHGENHTFAGQHRDDAYYAAIGVARSSDGGRTWRRGGAIVSGMVAKGKGASARSALGAGTPSVVTSGGWYWLYYVDWNTTSADAVHLARAPVSGGGKPGTWQKWYQGGFTQAGLGGRSTPVVTAPTAASIYAGLPAVSYNTALRLHLMVFESNDAFWAAVSRDRVSWSGHTRILTNPAGAASRKPGQVWMSYATLITPGSSSDRVTGASGWLYLARGVWGVVDHTMWRVPLTIAAGVRR